jgi:membrane fusion protein, multidrug efflux system
MERFVMNHASIRGRMLVAGVALTLAAAGVAGFLASARTQAQTGGPQGLPPPATPVSVAVVEPREVATWSEFSGRLEAVERVEIRSRVAGALQSVNFREGALVQKGDRLITIDPGPYAAEVARAEAQVVAAEAREALTKKERERGQQLQQTGSSAISQSSLDQRVSAHNEAAAALRGAQAALQAARLNLQYTEIRAPVSGRMGRLEVTVGNLVAAGPDAPLLTTLVSVNPIYASFNADELVVTQALSALGADPASGRDVERIPVQMVTATSNGTTYEGRLQLIDNQFDARSGTVRVRAVFDNADGILIPGQFARVRMGQAKSQPALLVSERAVGTDQNKKFVMVVDSENKANYREVTLGASVGDLRLVTSGLESGERVVVNGLQRVRPGAPVVPEVVPMDLKPERQAQTENPASR